LRRGNNRQVVEIGRDFGMALTETPLVDSDSPREQRFRFPVTVLGFVNSARALDRVAVSTESWNG